MTCDYSEYVRHQADLRLESRLPGISGFMRLRNEEHFVELAIESHLPFVNELVVVLNGCTDRTPRIVEACRQRHPDKIKVFDYEPEVYPIWTREYQTLPPDSPHSLVNYYNFALCQTTRRIALKIDGDMVAIPNQMRRLLRVVRRRGLRRLKFWRQFHAVLLFVGLNLWEHQGRLYVNGKFPLTHYDHCFFPVTRETWHIRTPGWERLTTGRLPRWEVPLIGYYHLKGLKADRGMGVADLRQATSNHYRRDFAAKYEAPPLIPLEEFRRQNRLAARLPDPVSLGIPTHLNGASLPTMPA